MVGSSSFEIVGTGHLGTGHWEPATGNRPLGTGHWEPATGNRPLVLRGSRPEFVWDGPGQEGAEKGFEERDLSVVAASI